jgi:hypothetical protein
MATHAPTVIVFRRYDHEAEDRPAKRRSRQVGMRGNPIWI